MYRLGGACKQIFKCNIPNSFHQQRWLETKPCTSSDHFQKKDKIDEGYKLIYSPPKTELLLTANAIFTCSAIFAPVLLSSHCYAKFFTENTIPMNEIATPIIMSVSSILILYFIRTLPIRIYRNKDQYTAVLPSLTGADRKFHFEKGDIVDKNLTVNEKLPLLEANISEASWFNIKGKRMFLVTKYFVRPRDFFDMFANSRKYVMQAKRMEREEKQKLSKSDEN